MVTTIVDLSLRAGIASPNRAAPAITLWFDEGQTSPPFGCTI
jgi:hypothetical protein